MEKNKKSSVNSAGPGGHKGAKNIWNFVPKSYDKNVMMKGLRKYGGKNIHP